MDGCCGVSCSAPTADNDDDDNHHSPSLGYLGMGDGVAAWAETLVQQARDSHY